MLIITKTFLYWYYPKLEAAQELLSQLGRLAPSQLEGEQWLRQPMNLGEARHLRIDALLGYLRRELGDRSIQIRYEIGKQQADLRLSSRFGHSGLVPMQLPRSVNDYLACREPLPIKAELDRVQTTAVLALARAEGITPTQLVNRAIFEYIVAHGCTLMGRLGDNQDSGSELAADLRRQGYHPHEFVLAYRSFAASFLSGRPMSA